MSAEFLADLNMRDRTQLLEARRKALAILHNAEAKRLELARQEAAEMMEEEKP